MCRAIQCSKCKKPTWAGCGAHVEKVLANVPKAQRCACREAASEAPPKGLGHSLRRLFGGE